MANPQPDEFTKISNELYTAIMQTNFSKRQRNIIDLVIRMSYGCHKKSALLRPADFEVVGVYKTHVRKELDYLAQAKVLFIDGDRITLNKDYDQWRVSLVKGAANQKSLEAILHRNIEDQAAGKRTADRSQKVTETVTPEDKQVTKTVTEVTKTVTSHEDGGYQNSNHMVTKTVTDCALEANGAKGSSAPKESIKDSTWVDLNPPTPLKDKKPETIDGILMRFPRYSSEQLTIIRDYWELIRFTRKTGRVAANIVARHMEYWERFPVDVVLEALDIHMRKYQTKQEDYTSGIMRRLVKERELQEKGVNTNGQGCQLSRASPAKDAGAGLDLSNFLWKGT